MEEWKYTPVRLKNYVTSLKNQRNDSVKKNQTLFLNGIRDREYDVINDQCDILSLSDTILKLQNKAINLGKISSSTANTRSNRQVNNRHINLKKVNVKNKNSS